MSAELLFLRHAPTAWNEERRIQGRADPPLSDAGRDALKYWRLPPAFEGAPVLTSPLRRAVETAAQFGRARTELRLVEMAWGRWEGQRLRDLRAADPEGIAAMEARGLDFRPPGGESPREVVDRLRSLLADLADHERVVLVTHKGVLQALLALTTGWAFAGRPPLKVKDAVAWRLEVANGIADRPPEPLPLAEGASACGS